MEHTEKPKKHRTEWNSEEIFFLKTHYGVIQTRLIAKRLGRTEDAIRWMIRKLGLRLVDRYSSWTEEEKEIIRIHYSRGDGIKHVMSLLPGRTRGAILIMVNKLGVHSSGTRRWSESERKILIQFYSVEGLAVTSRLPGRTRNAIITMARQMEIPSPYNEKGPRQQKWTPEEWLRIEKYDHLPLTELSALFPERTQISVRKARDRSKVRRTHSKRH